ncbi:hypothetical protein MPH47_00170 [Psychrobacillus psychrodurans]|jgi:hypothetical protein|uniref:Nucleotide kinase n=1 Tax=Psychrobacillus psychrodurans TaxID=126157 RepID=A0A9X3L6A7_9BACI|nr:hypothetical protein [Psychrobacillus psychrodurans]MCK1995644.1 hypothetical protein [Psychrobacillus psychrodurans]MCZ8532160.1 hypothetical protein [Psychrobacillus psychrodurans]MCZ8538909.1 hypothetical protein [Psychrobacillus psychrodurans]SFM24701.1 hypothetical protein SAMN05421832_101262 [Psychrobacillus psychrodurans]
MNGIITHYMGRSYTGQGVKSFYKEIIQEANKVYFFKGPTTYRLTDIFKEIGYNAVRRGKNMEWFYDPMHEDLLEGLYINETKTLYLQADTVDPTYYGAGHEWVPYYEAYNDRKLRDIGPIVKEKQISNDVWLTKGLQALSRAKKIHDEWEQLIQVAISWDGITALLEDCTKNNIGNIQLQKNPKVTHRLMGSLTPLGAKDTLESISKNLKTRLYIKGLPGSGKSSFMKKFGEEAKLHGLDVRYIWCGLDANSVDGVVLPQLQLCVVDATSPHIYEPERDGDEIIDFFPHIDQTKLNEDKILEVRNRYSNEMELAQDYLCTYAGESKMIKMLYDSAIEEDKWSELQEKMLETIR